MPRKHDYSTLVPDALAMIAACSESPPLMELAVALRAVVRGEILLPPDRFETISRIATDLINPHWNVQAHVTLLDPRVQYYAKAFCRACIQSAPVASQERNLSWHTRVKSAYSQNPSLRQLGELLIAHVRLRVRPAPVATVSMKNASTKSTKAELLAKAKTFAEQFVRHWEAQKARAAEANAPVPIPEPVQAPPVTKVVAPTPTPLASPIRAFVSSTRVEELLPIFPQSVHLGQSITPASGAPPS